MKATARSLCRHGALPAVAFALLHGAVVVSSTGCGGGGADRGEPTPTPTPTPTPSASASPTPSPSPGATPTPIPSPTPTPEPTPTPVPVVVTIAPAQATVSVGDTVTFTAGVSGAANTAVTWSVPESNGGSISVGGAYRAPGVPGTYHIIATSQADGTRTAQATVIVQAGAATGTIQ